MSNFLRIYIVPGAVFQSVMIAGGYGTGRELVEYFTRYGLMGGLLGMTITVFCFALVLAVTYEFARCYRVYDYRRFFRALLGGGWVAFEVLYLLMFVLVLAVIGAAAGRILQEQLAIPGFVGVGVMLVAVALLGFFGRDWITKVLTFWSVLLYAVFIAYFYVVLMRHGDVVVTAFGRGGFVTGWAQGGIRYALYSSMVIPAILFATRAIKTRRQAVISGIASALIAMIPALLFHISFGAAYPEILAQEIPTYWMLQRLGVPMLMTAYVIVLFGTFIESGAGIIQGLNERLDGWYKEKHGRVLGPAVHATVGVMSLLLAGALSAFGVTKLIAKGYGTMAWGFLAVYIAPLMTLGVYKLWQRKNSLLHAKSSRGQ